MTYQNLDLVSISVKSKKLNYDFFLMETAFMVKTNDITLMIIIIIKMTF